MSRLEELQNYRIITSEDIPEVNGKGYVLEHLKTKARVLIIENDDANKVFTIGFRTPPNDDSGIPHILEHSVLCGSKKYPVKDPFVELAKGSLNTFLNAMTYSDKTVYPIASCNNQDFENLMQVYLDAVFYPNIYIHPEIMRQEGWHYELDSVDGELKYNGVVYNEMKGVFSSAEQQLYRVIEMSLLPDTPYGKESGGDPKAIPTLTQERFQAFHQTYYHPSNSYIYLYGDCDMADKLEYIDREYLSNFAYKEVDSHIAMQTPFDNMKQIETYYSISENETEENNTYLAYSKVIGSSLDKKQATAMAILEYALMDAPGAPLKKAIIDAGIGEDVFSSFDGGIQQTSFSVIAKNANESDKDLFVKTIEDTLKQALEKLDKRSVEAAINNFEFKHKEANFGRYPKGLMLGLDAFKSWLYDGEALSYFKMNDIYTELKEELKTDYFEEIIRNRLLENSFGAIIVMKPKKGLDKEEEQAEKEKLAAYKATLNHEELCQLVADTKTLKKYQEEPSPAEVMEKVPLLNISDIDKKAKLLKNRRIEMAGVPAVHHDIFTNGIGYLEFFFKINDLEEKLIPYASLLTAIFKYVDTEKHSYGELSNEINFHTGGIAFSTGAFNNVDKSITTYFSVRTKAMYDKLGKAIELVEEILKFSKTGDRKRLKEIISEEKAGMKSELAASGHISTANRAMSYIDKSLVFKDMSEGVGYYEFLLDIDAAFDEKAEELAKKLSAVLDFILEKSRLTISYTGDFDSLKKIEKDIDGFVDILSNHKTCHGDADYELSVKNEGFKTTSQVQYVAIAGDFVKAGYEYDAALNVLQVIFSYGYLWENVRVKGGAYGAMCTFARSGISYMTSYRDPNLMETYDVYKNAYQYVETFNPDERDMTKYLIGAIAKLDAPMTPSAEGSYCFLCYMAGVTDEMIQQERDQILATNPEKIRSLAPIIKSVTDSGIICAIGGEDKIEENRENFENILSIF